MTDTLAETAQDDPGAGTTVWTLIRSAGSTGCGPKVRTTTNPLANSTPFCDAPPVARFTAGERGFADLLHADPADPGCEHGSEIIDQYVELELAEQDAPRSSPDSPRTCAPAQHAG